METKFFERLLYVYRRWSYLGTFLRQLQIIYLLPQIYFQRVETTLQSLCFRSQNRYTFAASPLDRFREDVVDYGFEFTLMATVDLFYEIDELLPFGSRA